MMNKKIEKLHILIYLLIKILINRTIGILSKHIFKQPKYNVLYAICDSVKYNTNFNKYIKII